jgi:glycosyltransferase involved in cell wall biosynthesis
MIASIENQTFDNYEIIIVNDHSTDDTNEFLNTLKKNSKFKVINNSSNIGLQASRIKAAALAKYEYIIQLDDDDEMFSFCLENYYKILKKKDYDFINTNYAINQSVENFPNHNFLIKEYDDFNNLPSHKIHPKSIWSFVVKKKIVQSIYKNNLIKIDYGEDVVFICNLYKISNNFATADFQSISYNKNYSSMTNIAKFNHKTINEFIDCHSYVSLIWGKNSMVTHLINHITLNWRYSVFKIIEKKISNADLINFKSKFKYLYSEFDYDLNRKIFTQIYPLSKNYILNQKKDFLKVISN